MDLDYWFNHWITLKNASKIFNLIFNSKLNSKYSFKLWFIQFGNKIYKSISGPDNVLSVQIRSLSHSFHAFFHIISPFSHVLFIHSIIHSSLRRNYSLTNYPFKKFKIIHSKKLVIHLKIDDRPGRKESEKAGSHDFAMYILSARIPISHISAFLIHLIITELTELGWCKSRVNLYKLFYWGLFQGCYRTNKYNASQRKWQWQWKCESM